MKFVFFSFDKAKAGKLVKLELNALFCDMHDVNDLGKNEKEALFRCGAEEAGAMMGFDEFCDMDRQFPRLCHPAQELQAKMIENTFGFEWWDAKRLALEKQRNLPFERARHKCSSTIASLETERRRRLRKAIGKWRERWANTAWARMPGRVMQTRVEMAEGSDLVSAGRGDILADLIAQSAAAILVAEQEFAAEFAAEATLKAEKESRVNRSIVRKRGRKAVEAEANKEKNLAHAAKLPPLVHEEHGGKLRVANDDEAAAIRAGEAKAAEEAARIEAESSDDSDALGSKKKKRRRRRKKIKGNAGGGSGGGGGGSSSNSSTHKKAAVHPGDGKEASSEQVVQGRIDAFELTERTKQEQKHEEQQPEFIMSAGMVPMAGDFPLEITEL